MARSVAVLAARAHAPVARAMRFTPFGCSLLGRLVFAGELQILRRLACGTPLRMAMVLAPFGGQHEQKHDALQRQLAVRRIVPLIAGVDAASIPSGTDADRGHAK